MEFTAVGNTGTKFKAKTEYGEVSISFFKELKSPYTKDAYDDKATVDFFANEHPGLKVNGKVYRGYIGMRRDLYENRVVWQFTSGVYFSPVLTDNARTKLYEMTRNIIQEIERVMGVSLTWASNLESLKYKRQRLESERADIQKRVGELEKELNSVEEQITIQQIQIDFDVKGAM